PVVPQVELQSTSRAAVPLFDVVETGFRLLCRVGCLYRPDAAPRAVEELEQAIRGTARVFCVRVPRRLFLNESLQRLPFRTDTPAIFLRDHHDLIADWTRTWRAQAASVAAHK